MKKSIENSYQLNAKIWVFHSGRHSPLSVVPSQKGKAWATNIKTSVELAKYAENFGINCAIENMIYPGFFLLSKLEEIQKFFGENEIISQSNLGICFDVGHASLISRDSIQNFLEALKKKIFHVHLHENVGKSDSHSPISGKNINLKELFNELKSKNSYDRWIILEHKTLKHAKMSFEILKKFI